MIDFSKVESSIPATRVCLHQRRKTKVGEEAFVLEALAEVEVVWVVLVAFLKSIKEISNIQIFKRLILVENLKNVLTSRVCPSRDTKNVA